MLPMFMYICNSCLQSRRILPMWTLCASNAHLVFIRDCIVGAFMVKLCKTVHIICIMIGMFGETLFVFVQRWYYKDIFRLLIYIDTLMLETSDSVQTLRSWYFNTKKKIPKNNIWIEKRQRIIKTWIKIHNEYIHRFLHKRVKIK